MSDPRLSAFSQAVNWSLVVLVALPALLGTHYLYTECTDEQVDTPIDVQAQLVDVGRWMDLSCAVTFKHPLVAVNVIFFLNVCVLFWVISLIQQSTWLIDPYWTIIPPLIGMFFACHPLAHPDPTRSAIALTLLGVWSVRLTHSYFRREQWVVGHREDWRFEDMRKQLGGHWWWISFWAAYFSQQLMLVGICLPLYPIMFSNAGWSVTDTVGSAICLGGLVTAYFADTQLREFMVANERRRAEGKSPVLILETGLWYYSRHPNYFGECSWWTGLAVLSFACGGVWTLIGTAFNTLCMVQVTHLTETRMLARPERAAAFKVYRARTSAWVPLPKRSRPEYVEIDDTHGG